MKKYVLFSLLFLGMCFIPGKVSALNQVNIYFFHWNQCSHCRDEENFLEKVENRYSNIQVFRYEVTDEVNSNWMTEAKKIFGQTGGSVPFTVIGDEYFSGYSTGISQKMEAKIRQLSEQEGPYSDKLASLLNTTYQTDLQGSLPEPLTEEENPTSPSPSVEPTSTPETNEKEQRGRWGGIILIGFLVVIVGSAVWLNISQYRIKKLKK